MITVYQYTNTHNPDTNPDKYSEVAFKVGFAPKAFAVADFAAAGDIVYIKVGEVDTDDLDVAFERTNSIDAGWWENHDVTPLFTAKGCRSTSVGDILVTEDGKQHMVSSFGFSDIRVELK